jgi:predicted ATPase/DNA-binding CsgD family transcriptional regulator
MSISSTRFVGRTEELGRLSDALGAVARGTRRVVLVAGEAGVGKTRLIEEFSSRASDQGAVSTLGGCVDVSGGLPFAPFAEAFRRVLRSSEPGLRDRWFPPAVRAEMARLVPDVGPDDEPAADAASARARLFELGLEMFARVSEEAPVVLVLEDLHWADSSTRDLIRFLVRNLERERVLLVGTYRVDDVGRAHPLRPLLAELMRAGGVERIDLRPFTKGELAEQLAAIVGHAPDPGLLEAVFSRSEGNAFYAEELVAAGPEAGLSPTLRDVLGVRVEGLSEPARSVLRALAAGGRRVGDRLLAAVVELDEQARADALRETISEQLIVLDGERGAYAFRHTLLREAVYEELLPGERVRLHAGYARALAGDASLAEGVAEAASELAHHSFAAYDLERALTASVEAAELATRRWGFAEARAHCERALELWDRVDPGARPLAGDRVALLRRAAEAANLEGDHRRAAELVRAALALVDEEAEPERAGVLYTRLGRFLWAAGEGSDALTAYEQALEIVPSEPPSDARGRVLAARGQALMLTARYAESAECCREAIAIAQHTGARAVEGHAMNTLGVDLAYLGSSDAAAAQLREARAIAEEVGDLDDLARAHLNLADTLLGILGSPAEAVEEGRLGVERCRALGLARDYGVSLQAIVAEGLLELGHWDEAEAELRDAAAANPIEMAAVDVLHTRIPLLVGRGEFDRAGEDLARARQLTIHTIDPQYVGRRCSNEAERALWLGRPEEARAAVDEGLELLAGTDDTRHTGRLLWLGSWAEADLADRARAQRAGGRLAESEAALDRLLDRARSLAGAGGTMPAFLALCEAESGRARRASDPSAWARAASAWSELERPYPAAYARWRQAEALLADRRGRDAEPILRDAHAIARRLGAAPLAHELESLARRARISLEDASAQAPPAPADTDHELTPRELEVLTLVAAGRTNREIAEALFVSEKTAGHHVSSILRKLGVRGRVEAAGAAQRLGLVD